jgi:hypothetical protein
MKKNKINALCLVLISFLLNINALNSQSIFIKIKKGSIYKNNDKLTNETSIFKLDKNDTLKVERAIVIAQIDNSYEEIPKRSKPYTFKEIASLKSANKQTKKKSLGVFDVVLANSLQKNTKNVGLVTRGFSRDAEFYSPLDSLYILSDSVLLDFGNENTNLLTNLVVKNIETGKVYYDDKPIYNEVILFNLPSGEYSWVYTMLINENNKKSTSTYENIFRIPSTDFKAEFYKKYDSFRTFLNDETGFSEDLKTILIKEFYENEMVYNQEQL